MGYYNTITQIDFIKIRCVIHFNICLQFVSSLHCLDNLQILNTPNNIIPIIND